MVEYEVYFYMSGRKIPSEPAKLFIKAKDADGLRKILLRKYAVHFNGSKGMWGDFEVYLRNSDRFIGKLIFNRNSKLYGPYYWQKPKNFYNGKRDTWRVNPETGRLIR